MYLVHSFVSGARMFRSFSSIMLERMNAVRYSNYEELDILVLLIALKLG